MLHAMANLAADLTPHFYLENIKRMVKNEIQPHSVPLTSTALSPRSV